MGHLECPWNKSHQSFYSAKKLPFWWMSSFNVRESLLNNDGPTVYMPPRNSLAAQLGLSRPSSLAFPPAITKLSFQFMIQCWCRNHLRLTQIGAFCYVLKFNLEYWSCSDPVSSNAIKSSLIYLYFNNDHTWSWDKHEIEWVCSCIVNRCIITGKWSELIQCPKRHQNWNHRLHIALSLGELQLLYLSACFKCSWLRFSCANANSYRGQANSAVHENDENGNDFGS